MDPMRLTGMDVAAARNGFTHRLAALERRVVGNTEDAVDQVKRVATTVAEVSGEIREALDLPKQVRKHPWQSLGFATSAGFFVALTSRGRTAPSNGTSLVDQLLGVARREFAAVAETVIAAGAASVKEGFLNRESIHSSESPSL